MSTKTIVSIIVVIIILLAGYWIYTSSQTVEPLNDDQMMGENTDGTVQGATVNPAAAAARADLAAKLGVPESAITVTEVSPETWSDGCLGLGGIDESCLAALVEGFKVSLEVNGAPYVYRTNVTGDNLRLEVGAKG